MKWWYEAPIRDAMKKCKTKEKAAEYLNISVRTLRYYCKEIWKKDKSFPYFNPKFDGSKPN